MLYEHIHEGSLSYYAWLVGLLVILLLSDTSALGMAVWAVLAVAVHLSKEKIISRFFALDVVNAPLLWERRMTIASFAEGFVISAGMMILIDLNHYLAAFVSIALIMIPAYASALVLIASIQTHYAWLLAMLLPVIVKSWTSDDSMYWIFGGITLTAGIPISVLLGKKLNKTFVDILNLRFENAELLAAAQEEKKRAEQASVDKTRFLASASHDLRQPIHALELFSDALEHELDNPVQFQLIEKMKESTAAMNGLLCSLLDISRLDAGIVKVDKRALSVTFLLERLIKTIQPQAQLKGVEVLFDGRPCAAISDAVLLESMLHNLLNNALKYTDKGTITINCEIDSGKTRISVADTGIGISESDISNIFNEFFQVDNSARDRSKGLGLGLTIVKNTCELLNHDIEILSDIEKGSVFTLVLEMAEIADIEQLDFEHPIGNKLHATVLVIDDENAILEGMTKMLQPWGCDVLAASSLDDALVLLTQHEEDVDLIIADYRLQDEKLGTDAVTTIQQTRPNNSIPAIIITGDTGPEQLKNVKDSGFHVLHKPVAPIRIRALMQNLLRQANKI